MNILILGTKSHEGKMLGQAMQYLSDAAICYSQNTHTLPGLDDFDVVILSQEWDLQQRLNLIQIKKKRLPIIYLMDGVIEWDYIWNNQSFVHPEKAIVLQPLIADYLCVLGQHPARLLSGLGLSKQIHIIGMPRFDKEEWVRKLCRKNKPKILITTAKTYGHNIAHKISVKQALRDLIKYFSNHIDIEPVWRLSPELHSELDLPQSSNKPISSELCLCHASISFTSTVILESMKYGIPTAQIEYRCVPLYVNTAWNIRSPYHIEPVIHELIHPSTEKQAFQELCLNDELENNSNASERLAALIKDIADNKNNQKDIENKKTIVKGYVSGVLDYQQVHSQLSSFSIHDKSVLQYELDAVYRYYIQYQELSNTLPFRVLFSFLKYFGWLPGMKKASRIFHKIASL